eukprot:CAMPEP_0202472422 /NCGR_PEP_ID=MMETSP1360-20130828/87710_1 /ASSEMBLY_ACC=CAM_ASM_000848 /TAXON_ID=515479 /ORGANISM="Licmophora paradoxa, Strain CCMP2313" /LENGTH=38 /DNA_ID= /DNA_START= /DNA_END= /DNA_ORIENTATION=
MNHPVDQEEQERAPAKEEEHDLRAGSLTGHGDGNEVVV